MHMHFEGTMMCKRSDEILQHGTELPNDELVRASMYKKNSKDAEGRRSVASVPSPWGNRTSCAAGRFGASLRFIPISNPPS